MITTAAAINLHPSMIEVADRVGNQAILAIAAGAEHIAGELLLLHAQLLGGLVLDETDTIRVLDWLDKRNAEWSQLVAPEFRH